MFRVNRPGAAPGPAAFGGVERRPCPPQADCPKGKAGAERPQTLARFFPSVVAMTACRGPVVQSTVWPLVVVEVKVALESGVERLPVGIVLEVHILVLHRPPQPLDEHVVERPAAAVHADAYCGLEQRTRELLARKLAALVGVEDLRMALAQRLPERRNAEPASHTVGKVVIVR